MMNVALQPSPQNMELENLEAIGWYSLSHAKNLWFWVSLVLVQISWLEKTRVQPAGLQNALEDITVGIT